MDRNGLSEFGGCLSRSPVIQSFTPKAVPPQLKKEQLDQMGHELGLELNVEKPRAPSNPRSARRTTHPVSPSC